INTLEPEPMELMLGEYVEQFGVHIIGGCCGTTPQHLEAIVRRVESRERVEGEGLRLEGRTAAPGPRPIAAELHLENSSSERAPARRTAALHRQNSTLQPGVVRGSKS